MKSRFCSLKIMNFGGVKMSDGFVVLMGIGTVFVGLICIIIVCSIMSLIIRASEKNKPEAVKSNSYAPVVSDTGSQVIADRDKLVVAISAAIAEEIGEDAGAIRILSLKKI